MSSIWTPGGERPVPRPGEPAEPGPGEQHRDPTPEELQAMLAEIASTPVEAVVVNHVVGLFELARIHLSIQPPQLAEAKVAIDAIGGIVDACTGRLGADEDAVKEGLTQLRLAYVQLQTAAGGGPGEPGDT